MIETETLKAQENEQEIKELPKIEVKDNNSPILGILFCAVFALI